MKQKNNLTDEADFSRPNRDKVEKQEALSLIYNNGSEKKCQDVPLLLVIIDKTGEADLCKEQNVKKGIEKQKNVF